MNSLHDKILNIPFINRVFNKKEEKTAYRLGHHDARHAAAELAMEADELNEELIGSLENLISYTKSCEALLNVTNSGHVYKVEEIIAKAKGHQNGN